MNLSMSDDFKFKSLKKSVDNKKTFKINPTSQPNEFTYKNNRKIKFLLPNSGFLDTKNTVLQFYSDNSNKTISEATFNNFIECIINQLEIRLSNGREVENIRQYNIISINDKKLKMTDDYIKSVGENMQGIGDYYSRRNASDVGRNYSIKLLSSGFFNSCNVIPLGVLSKILNNSNPIEVELTLENPSVCMSSRRSFDGINDRSKFNYVVKDAYLLCDVYENQEYEDMIYKSLSEKDINMIYNSERLYQQYLESNRTGTINYAIHDDSALCNGVRTIMFKNPRPEHHDEEMTNQYTRPKGFKGYQYKSGSKYYPSNLVDVKSKYETSYAYNELMKYVGKDKLTNYCCGNSIGTKQLTSAWLNVNTVILDGSDGSEFPLPFNGAIECTPVNSFYRVGDDNDNYIQIPQSGLYKVIMNYTYSFGNTNPPPDSEPLIDVQVLFLSEGDALVSPSVIQTITQNNVVGSASVNNYYYNSSSDVVYLKKSQDDALGGFRVEVRLFNSDINQQFRLQDCRVYLELISDEESGYYTDDFCLGQSLKSDYEEGECEWITGRDIKNNPLSYHMVIDNADENVFNILHYVNYQSILKMSKNDVSIMK